MPFFLSANFLLFFDSDLALAVLFNQSFEVKDVQGALRLKNKMFEAQSAKMVKFLFALFILCFDRELAPAVFLQVFFAFFLLFLPILNLQYLIGFEVFLILIGIFYTFEVIT